jgi:hypothetical protein
MARRAFCRGCFENGHTTETWRHDSECRAYDAQLTFTRRVRRLLADSTPWYARAVHQAPDYSTPEAVTRAAAAGGHGDHLAAKGEELGVRFVRALRAAGGQWERDVLRDWRQPKARKAVA